jgi:hypothetical protein
MCLNLEKIQGKSLPGAGRIIFEGNHLKGEVRNPSDYYENDRRRYSKYLEDFKKGWNYYLSDLEIDLIESKITRILTSSTFKHTRQPGFLAMIPDRMQEINLRISDKLHLLVEKALTLNNSEKFYEHLTQA